MCERRREEKGGRGVVVVVLCKCVALCVTGMYWSIIAISVFDETIKHYLLFNSEICFK